MSSSRPWPPATPEHEQRRQEAITTAIGQFNRGLYFECHETLEEIWLDETGEDAYFLQGLIQAAAALHNLHRGRSGGPARLFASAQEKLLPYGKQHRGVALDKLLPQLERARTRAEELDQAQGDWDPAWDPRIAYREPPTPHRPR